MIRSFFRRLVTRLAHPELCWQPVTSSSPPEEEHVLFLSFDSDCNWWDIWVGYRTSEGYHVLPSYRQDPEALPTFWMPKDHLLDCKVSLHGIQSLE